MKYYPLAVDLRGRTCVVVGTGTVAERKVGQLLEVGARVRMIGPQVSPALEELARAGRIELERREYRPGDLAGARLAIAATDSPAVNAAIYAEAEERNALCNAVDDLASCSFIAPSVLRRGDFTVAVCSGGAAPALAARVRQRLEAEIGPEYGDAVAVLAELRKEIAGRCADPVERRAFWYRVIDQAVLAPGLPGDADAVRARVRGMLGDETVPR